MLLKVVLTPLVPPWACGFRTRRRSHLHQEADRCGSSAGVTTTDAQDADHGRYTAPNMKVDVFIPEQLYTRSKLCAGG
jgi:hypothetical protein